MTHSYIVKTTGSANRLMKQFGTTINPNLQESLNNIGKYSSWYSQTLAPVYNPSKYPSFAGFKNHYTPPGKLKASIRLLKTKRAYGLGSHNAALGVTYFIARVKANTKYASYVENGFIHHLSGKRVRGRRYMKAGARLAVSRHHKAEIEKAVRKSFGRTH